MDAVTVIRDLLAICERFKTTPNAEGRFHLDNREQLNHLGVCSQRLHWIGTGETVKDGSGFREIQRLDGVDAPICIAYQQAMLAGQRYLDEREPRQLGFEDLESEA